MLFFEDGSLLEEEGEFLPTNDVSFSRDSVPWQVGQHTFAAAILCLSLWSMAATAIYVAG
jgi:hypothetical protein